MKVGLILNSLSKQREAVLRATRAQEASISVLETTAVGDAKEMASRFDLGGDDLLVVAGGDGTWNEAINGWLQRPEGHRPTLALWPVGSANDFARTLPPFTLSQLVKGTFQVALLDAFSVQTFPAGITGGEAGRHYGTNISTAGIGAEIAQTVNQRRFQLPPMLNYYTAILYWLMRFKAPLVRVQTAEGAIETRAFLIAVGKGRFAGHGLGLLPHSAPDDGQLSICLIGRVGVIDFLRYQRTLKACVKVKDPRVHYLRSPWVEVEVLHGQMAIETDGEPLCVLKEGQRVRYDVQRAVLRMAIPGL